MSDSNSKTATIFVHPSRGSAALFQDILKEQGFEITIISTPTDNFSDFDALAPDLLLIMGAMIGIYQAPSFPFIYDEIEIIKKRIEADRPTLGICFGAQLIAAALGADVHRGLHGHEKGWHDIIVNEEGMETPLRHFSHTHTKMFQWHSDTFSFPHGAILLSSSKTYKHQAFCYGKNIMAVQFHPEVSPRRIKEFELNLICDLSSPDTELCLQKLRETTDLYIEKANEQSNKFLLEWLKNVGL